MSRTATALSIRRTPPPPSNALSSPFQQVIRTVDISVSACSSLLMGSIPHASICITNTHTHAVVSTRVVYIQRCALLPQVLSGRTGSASLASNCVPRVHHSSTQVTLLLLVDQNSNKKNILKKRENPTNLYFTIWLIVLKQSSCVNRKKKVKLLYCIHHQVAVGRLCFIAIGSSL